MRLLLEGGRPRWIHSVNCVLDTEVTEPLFSSKLISAK